MLNLSVVLKPQTAPTTFFEAVDLSVRENHTSHALTFLKEHPAQCVTDPSSVQRLLNHCTQYDHVEDVQHIFSTL